MGRTLDEIPAEEKREIAQAASVKADAIFLDILLAGVCSMLNEVQMDIDSSLGEAQPTLSALEREGTDISLSSLKRYVEATGAKLKLDIEPPNRAHHGFKV